MTNNVPYLTDLDMLPPDKPKAETRWLIKSGSEFVAVESDSWYLVTSVWSAFDFLSYNDAKIYLSYVNTIGNWSIVEYSLVPTSNL